MSPLASILLIVQTALNAMELIPATGPGAALAIPFVQILQASLTAYHQASGAPLDLTKIPLETPVA